MAATTPEFLESASRLSDGAVVYLAADRRWVERFDEAARHRDATARDAELAYAKQDEAHACNAHVVEIAVGVDGQLVLSTRERLRREGAERVRERLGYSNPNR
jgi:hypothetical protein